MRRWPLYAIRQELQSRKSEPGSNPVQEGQRIFFNRFVSIPTLS